MAYLYLYTMIVAFRMIEVAWLQAYFEQCRQIGITGKNSRYSFIFAMEWRHNEDINANKKIYIYLPTE